MGTVYWPNTVSLRDDELFDLASMMGYRQLTDIYLLGTAVSNRGALGHVSTAASVARVSGAPRRNI